RAGERPLRGHQRQHVRVWRPRVCAQQKVPNRESDGATRRVGARPHPCRRRWETRHLLVDQSLQGRGPACRASHAGGGETGWVMMEHRGMIIRGENLSGTRKIKGWSPRLNKEGERGGLPYPDLAGTKRVLDVTAAFPADPKEHANAMIPYIAQCLRNKDLK